MNVYPNGKLSDAFASVLALHKAGVDILAGSDVSEPIQASADLPTALVLHHELQLMVAAGLTPIEALRAATSTPARRFGLNDRGRIAVGARADLLLVNGDPTTNISDTLSVRTVWRRVSNSLPRSNPCREMPRASVDGYRSKKMTDGYDIGLGHSSPLSHKWPRLGHFFIVNGNIFNFKTDYIVSASFRYVL